MSASTTTSTDAGTTAEPTSPTGPAPRSASRRRTVKRILLGGTLVTVLAAAGGYFWLDATSDPKVLGKAECTDVTPSLTATASGRAATDDQRAVCTTLRALTDAWDRADATGYGEQFTEDATYTTYVGTHYQGRQDIADAHRALFDGFVEGTSLADSFLGIRFYGPDTAVVTSRGDTYKGDRPSAADLTKTQTYTLVREGDGHWRIAAFHNTKRQNVMERLSFLWDPATAPEAEK
ncbi:SgcJ/EcaC family oxidoreductase [Streptomyces sp. NPDC087866]|uniref:SgcJ/EcaC family oxidoreductase n=1 Tax=unclassified Streptomyces TaxID=2593676 RepID=UPI002257874D|nr:SgcJ/EcaC family oxidoreductase [Streptomyces sp. NBC_01789]MCX4451507.1 SgcJ/EcaC family oxidoreductase [Streptomyces sp. NBC_01789]